MIAGWTRARAGMGALALALAACGARTDSADEPPVKRGEYLVTRVGMCIDCHSPWKDGHPDPERPMAGSKIGFAPLGPVPGWQDTAPALAGLKDFTDDDIVKVLTTGTKATGKPTRPPMPPYRLTESDARAVVAYLKTLKAP